MPKPPFDPNQPFEAIQSPQGGKPAFDPNQPFDTIDRPTPAGSAVRGFAGGAAAGFDDELGGIVGAAGRLVGIKNLGSAKSISEWERDEDGLSWEEIKEAYRENRDAMRADQREDLRVNPASTIAGNVGGALFSPAAKLRAGKVATDASKLAKIANASKTAAIQGGVYGAGLSDADLTEGEYGEFIKDTAVGAGTGAAFPPALAATGWAARTTARGVGAAGKKLFRGVFGVTEDNASKYLQNKDKILRSPEFAHIKDEVDDAVSYYAKQVDDGKASVSQAKEALRDLKTRVRDQFRDAKFDATESMKKADDLFKSASAKALQPIKDVKAPTQLAREAVEAVGDLKQKVIQGSQSARRVLDSASQKVKLAPVYKQIDDRIASLRASGTDESLSVAKQLKNYKDRLLNEVGDEIEASLAKTKLQGLDSVSDYGALAGSFDKAKGAAFKSVRSALDKQLKSQVKEYGEAMEPVSKMTKLLERASVDFGDESRAISKLSQVGGNKGHLYRKTLQEIEEATGRRGSFTGKIDEFTNAQKFLKDPKRVDAALRELPEYKEFRNAAARLARMKNPQMSREQLKRQIANSKEARALMKAEEKLFKAERDFKPIQKLSRDKTQSIVESFGKPAGARIEVKRAIDSLGKLTGKNYTELLENRAVLDSFEKGMTNGSRNFWLWGAIGAIFGGIPGAVGGSTFGAAVMDKYGPRVGRLILDGIHKVKNNRGADFMRKVGEVVDDLNIPGPLKKELERELRVYSIVAGSAEDTLQRVAREDQSSTNRKPSSKGPSKWARDGAKNLGLSDERANRLLQSKKGKQLLIEASTARPGSKRMENIQKRLEKEWGNQ